MYLRAIVTENVHGICGCVSRPSGIVIKFLRGCSISVKRVQNALRCTKTVAFIAGENDDVKTSSCSLLLVFQLNYYFSFHGSLQKVDLRSDKSPSIPAGKAKAGMVHSVSG